MRIKVKRFNNKQEYREKRFDFFKKVKGIIPRVYTNGKGIPCVGIGYQLLDYGEGGYYKKHPGWIEDFKEAGVDFSGVDIRRCNEKLSQIAGILNRNGSNAIEMTQTVIKPWKSDEEPIESNGMGIPLLKDLQVYSLFNSTIEKSSKVLSGMIGNDAIAEELKDSWEMIVLLSLMFDNPSQVSPGLRRAIRKGNRAEAWFQIRYNSNRLQKTIIAMHRYFEAHMFGLYNDKANVDKEEANSIMKMYRRREALITPYENRFAVEIPRASELFDLTASSAILTIEKELQPALAAT